MEFIRVLLHIGHLKIPDYMSEITKLVQTKGALMSDILTQGGYMLLCAFGSLVSAIIVGYLISNIAASFSMRTRKSLFEKVENLYKEFEPKTRHIKYAVAIFSTDVDEDLVFVKEKYKLFSLRDIHHTFWSLYNKVQLLREE